MVYLCVGEKREGESSRAVLQPSRGRPAALRDANGGTIGGIDKSVKKAYNGGMPFIVIMLSIPVICRLMVMAGDAMIDKEPAPEKKP